MRAGRPTPRAAGAYLGELFAAHGRTILGLCRLLLRDGVEAEDATQQVFLSAHRSILRGRFPRDEPAWLASIARNECRARIRRRMREPLALPDLPDDLPDPLATAIRRVDLDALWVALSELPRRQRRAFLLREMGGLSYDELGAALGVTRPAVESLLFRARRQLRNALTGAAFVPVALRDQLGQLIPGFGAGPAASAPVVAKIAAVTAVGLTAAGAVELPHSHAHVMRTRAAVRVHHRVRTSAPVATPEPSIAQAAFAAPETSVRRRATERPGREPEQAERGQVGTEAEPPEEERAPAPVQPEEAAPITAQLSDQETSGSGSRDSGETSSEGDHGDSGGGSSSGD